MKLVLLYGLPGCGKTTLGNLLQKNNLSHHISCGNLLKNNDTNNIEGFIYNELLNLENYPNYLSLDGLKTNNDKNIIKNLNKEYPLNLVIFIDNINEDKIYLENKNIKKIKNYISFDNYDTNYINFLSNRLLERNRIDDTIEIINKRLEINKKINILVMNNVVNLSKYMKFNVLILNVNNSIEYNYKIVEEYLKV
jgi:adenylate kinase family enzyme